jgi:hypothetical protein
MDTSTAFDDLRTFRRSLHRCFDRRADALFELGDAMLTAGVVPSPVHLSLEPAHRRSWGSLYATLERGRIDAEALRTLVVRHPLAGERPPPIYAVDVSVWDRCDAETSPERGFYYHPSRHSAGQPIVAGWAYQFIAQIGFARESWVAPVDARRVRPAENANEVAAGQVVALLDRLPGSEGVALFEPCGRSPGRPRGRLSGRAKRHPALKRRPPEPANTANAGVLRWALSPSQNSLRLKHKLSTTVVIHVGSTHLRL